MRYYWYILLYYIHIIRTHSEPCGYLDIAPHQLHDKLSATICNPRFICFPCNQCAPHNDAGCNRHHHFQGVCLGFSQRRANEYGVTGEKTVYSPAVPCNLFEFASELSKFIDAGSMRLDTTPAEIC